MGARLVVTGTVLVALAGLGSLSACSDDETPKTPAAVEDTAGDLPKGDEATYLKALRALDANLVADEKTAVDNGYNLCRDAVNGMTVAEQLNDAINLFQVDATKGQRILAIATTNLCQTPASAGS
ncbi:hypothetical protein JIG36_31300 [Actinoplanes sp. LDG1-06]|uniref:DUF732 domain-containing protein n=1 Tax=Paractinoplanes ovalisporus TaxID=2810368 RepID=A0ABS2AJJ0_9ACTN|nr:DUF732 domain-containing protein [Actinoplanes ovalisporus]MBM2620009.1 hypothetical protein [Actinoplanes ovalisporus]